MKKSRIFAILLSLAVALICVNAFADDPAREISALQQKAESLQNQITQAQNKCDVGLESELRPLRSSIENLMQQRVQLGANISQLESQVDNLKKSTQASCRNQVKPAEQELSAVKQQITSLMAKQTAEAAQKGNEAQPGPAAAAAPAPTTTAPAAPAAPPAPGKSR